MDDPFSGLLQAIDIAQRTTDPADITADTTTGTNTDGTTSDTTTPTGKAPPSAKHSLSNGVSEDDECGAQTSRPAETGGTTSATNGTAQPGATSSGDKCGERGEGAEEVKHVPSEKGDGPPVTTSAAVTPPVTGETTRAAVVTTPPAPDKNSEGRTSPADEQETSGRPVSPKEREELLGSEEQVQEEDEEEEEVDEEMFTIENRPDDDGATIDDVPAESPAPHSTKDSEEPSSSAEMIDEDSRDIEEHTTTAAIAEPKDEEVEEEEGHDEVEEVHLTDCVDEGDSEDDDNDDDEGSVGSVHQVIEFAGIKEGEPDHASGDKKENSTDAEPPTRASSGAPRAARSIGRNAVVDLTEDVSNQTHDDALSLIIRNVASHSDPESASRHAASDDDDDDDDEPGDDDDVDEIEVSNRTGVERGEVGQDRRGSTGFTTSKRQESRASSCSPSSERSASRGGTPSSRRGSPSSPGAVGRRDTASVHVVIEPGRQSETISVDSGSEDAGIPSVRGNGAVADFHVIENSSPVVPVIIQPQPADPAPAPPGGSRPELGKRRKVGGSGKFVSKVQRTSSNGEVVADKPAAAATHARPFNQIVFPTSSAPGMLRPTISMQANKGRPAVRNIAPGGVRLIHTGDVTAPARYVTNAPRAVTTIFGRMPVPVPGGQQAFPGMPVQVLQSTGMPGPMTSIIGPRMATAIVQPPSAAQPKLYTLLIPTSLAGQQATTTTVLPRTVALSTAGAPGAGVTSTSMSFPVSLLSTLGTAAPAAGPGRKSPAVAAPGRDPKVDDNWAYHECNLVAKNVPATPPASLKLKYVSHYACKVCGDTFLSGRSLTEHLNRQSALLTYRCGVCSSGITAYNKCQLHIAHRRHVAGGCARSLLSATLKIAPLPANMMPPAYREQIKATTAAADSDSDASLPTREQRTEEEEAEEGPSPAGDKPGAVEKKSPQLQSRRLTYYCPECEATFSSKSSLAKHFVPRSAKNYTQCNKCLMLLHSACAYSAHMRIHVRDAPFVCPECGMEVLGARRVFLKHIKQKCLHFTRTSSFPCPRCDVSFAVKSQVQSHVVNVHADIYHKCAACPMAYKSMPSFEEHNRKAHGAGRDGGDGAGARTICKCPLCDTVYSTEKQLEQHISQHLGDATCKGRSTFKCLGCSFVDARKKNVITHMHRSHSNLIVLKEMCYVCGIEGVASDVQIHTYNVHPREYPKIYRHAGTSLVVEPDEEEEGGGEEEQEEAAEDGAAAPDRAVKKEAGDPEEAEAKPEWECHRCEKVFSSGESHRKHMAKHRFIERKMKANQNNAQSQAILTVPKVAKKEFTKQVPGAPSHQPRFPCAVCDSWFFVDTDLTEHMKLQHKKNSQFPCHLCGMTYPEKFLIDKHLKTVHQGKSKDFNYLCSLCLEASSRKGFNSRGTLIQHLCAEHKLKKGNAEISKVIRDCSTAAKSLDLETLPSPEKIGDARGGDADGGVKRLKVDGGGGAFVCAKCGHTSEDRGAFAEHLARHTSVDACALQCRECGLSFAVQVSLKRHLFMVHRVRDFVAYLAQTGVDLERPPDEAELGALIGKTGSSQILLPNGLRRAHAGSVSSESSVEKEKKPKAEDNPLECTVCYKVFTTMVAMHTHMRTHGMAFIRSKRKLSSSD